MSEKLKCTDCGSIHEMTDALWLKCSMCGHEGLGCVYEMSSENFFDL